MKTEPLEAKMYGNPSVEARSKLELRGLASMGSNGAPWLDLPRNSEPSTAALPWTSELLELATATVLLLQKYTRQARALSEAL